MKLVYYVLLLLILSKSAIAQKIVVGSEIPTIKNMKDNIVWLNGLPDEGKFQIIDFFQSENKSCMANLDRLRYIHSTNEKKINIIILTKEYDDNIQKFAQSCNGEFFVGIDTTGNGYFEKCFVKYIPYSLFVNHRSILIWHGLLNTLSDEMIEEEIDNVKP